MVKCAGAFNLFLFIAVYFICSKSFSIIRFCGKTFIVTIMELIRHILKKIKICSAFFLFFNNPQYPKYSCFILI